MISFTKKKFLGDDKMARIGILTCSNATQDLGCSSVSCLHDMRKRKQFRAELKKTLCQLQRTMVDIIKGK